MTDNKKYIINVGDQTEEWTSDMYAQKGDTLFAKYKDAEVFEVEEAADFDEDPTDHQYIINVGDESEVWDGDMVKEKGAKLKEAYPDVMIQRVSYKDYWGEQATANRERRALLAQPDQERNAKLADLGYYDDLTGEAFTYKQSEEGVPQYGPSIGLKPLSSVISQSPVTGATTYSDPAVESFFADDTYADMQAESARLDAEYESNPSVIAQKEYEAQMRAEQDRYIDDQLAAIRSEIETKVDAVEAGRGAFYKTASAQGMGDAAIIQQAMDFMRGKDAGKALVENEKLETYESAAKLFEKAKQANEIASKGFWGAVGDVAKDKLRNLATQSDIEAYAEIGDILSRLETKYGNLEDVTEEMIESSLSPEEQALIKGFFEYNKAMANAQQDMSKAYKGGKIFAESISFMLEFLATGGLASGTGKAATSAFGRAFVNWATKAARGTARRAVRKGVVKGLSGLTSAMVGTLARTAAAPGTYKRAAEESVKIEDGHLDRTKNVFKSFADSYIENLSEISGGLIGKGLGLLGKGIGKAASMSGIPFSKLGSLLADNRLMQIITAGWKSIAPKFEALGFHGIFEEIGEEYIGNAIRELTIQPGALAEMHKDDNFGAMLIGFAPMTLFGGAVSAVTIGARNIEAANLGNKLRETLGQHYSEEQVEHMMNLVSGAENAEEVWEAVKPLTAGLNAEETQQLLQYGAFMAQNKAMLFARQAQEDNLAQAKRAQLQQTYNKFWQENAEGVESVQLASLNDGRTVFVVSEPTADGVVSIIDASTGAKGFTNVSNYKTEEVDGAAVPMTQTWSMDAYLEGEIASERRTAEGARMEREYNEQVKNLQSQIKEGTRINLGTEGNPVIMLATGQFVKDGVIAVDQAGNSHTIGWNQVADAMQQPIGVKTDQQIIDEEIAAVVARNAERRKGMSNATPAMTEAVDESAAQTSEAVALESMHIPMNEDGTVNEAAFWEQDPEEYVQWNDEQNQDGGADSLQQIAITKAVLASLLAEAQQAQQTTNPAERKAAKQRAQEIAEKIDRLTAIEASYAEQRLAPLRERAMRWKGLTNAPVHIVETEEELASISGQAAESSRGGVRVRGFAKDGRAYIYLPGIVEESEIDAVFMHEAVAHTGLKGLLGQEQFDELCDQVWEMMSPEMQQFFINYPGVNGNTRAAADEYIAHIAEAMGAGVATEEEKTVWQQIIDFVRNVLRSMGITLNVSESELSDLIHMAYADLARNMAEAENIAAQQKEARAAEQNAPSAARQEYNTYAEDLTHDEIKAVAENDFTAAQQAYDALVGSAPRVEAGESAKDFIARKKAYNEQVAEAKAALDARQALMDEIARIDAENAPVLTDAELLERDGLGVDLQNDDVRMSVRYVPTEKQREMIIGSIMNVTGRTREEAERWLTSETSLAAMINENLQYLDYVADPKYKAIKDNSDYPQGTVDFNNICRKRVPFTRMFTRLQRRYPNRVFTADELADIRTIMSQNDLMVACGLCYVEDRRQMVGEVAQSFIDGLQDKFKTYANNPTKKKNAKKFNELAAGDTYVPQVYDLTTQEGLDKLYKEHRGIWEAFQAFNNARGQQSQNLLQGYAEYKREILSWSDKKVKSVNDNGGLRIFSYSDFEAHHLIDVVQIIIDCAAKGVKIQGYTKVPEFARAVAKTGIKLNRSLIPLGDTGLVDGQLAFDPVEGIDINDPNFLESNDNVGNILIGINDEQIRVAMADPRIHYIIPYHARQKENIRQKLNVGAWTNYISTQNERNISDGKRVKDNINIYTEILNGEITNERQFVEKYLELCAEKGRIPKFGQFLERDAEGNYVYTPGYYKFLVDFKLFDENGNILLQQPVVAEFDDAFNMQILENYAKDERESTGEQMNETYDKIVEKLNLDESTAEGEDVRFSTVQEVNDKFNAELQQQIEGSLPAGHVYQLGMPSAILRATGFPNLPIEMTATRLNEKSKQENHPFNISEVKNLVKELHNPWAVFRYGNSAKNVIIGIEHNGKQFLIGVHFNQAHRGMEVSDIRGIFPKDNAEWLNWISQGKADYLNKKKIQALIDKQRINLAEVEYLDLDSVAKIVNDFVNPSITAENEDIRFSIRTDEQREALFDKAKAQFGLTNNFKVAGYMLPDGSLLDFSEANDGGDPNQRTLDHREIEGIIMDEGREYDSRWMYLADFMNEGAIRLLPEYAGINLMKAPTKEQRSRLFDFIYKYNGEVILEIADERLNNVAYVEYDRRTSPSRIFRDIDGYFNEGIVPQQDVRFSARESSMDEMDSLFKEYNNDETLSALYDKVSALAHTMGLKIKFDNPWSNAAGTTVADKVKFNSMFMDSPYQPAEKKAHAILHELIHATTQYAIQAKKAGLLTEDMTEAVNQLDNIYNEIKADSAFEGMKGAESVHEMVAELANPEFRAALKEKNLFGQIVEAIKRILGIETGENALDNLSSTLEYILENFDANAYRKYVDVAQKNEGYTRFSVANESQVSITPEVREEMDRIAANAIIDGNYMLAPNGQPTKLNADQWALVRTQNFLDWFGDWMNDPENASKVVDENSEPKVVYHGSGEEKFNEFAKGDTGFHFGNYYAALMRNYMTVDYEGVIQEFFLNIRNPLYIKADARDWTGVGMAKFFLTESDEVNERAGSFGLVQRGGSEYNPFKSEEDLAKLQEISQMEEEKSNAAMRGFLTGKNYDGIFYLNEVEISPSEEEDVSYMALLPNQIKSATETTGEFSESEDIRFSANFANPMNSQNNTATLEKSAETHIKSTVNRLVDESVQGLYAWENAILVGEDGEYHMFIVDNRYKFRLNESNTSLFAIEDGKEVLIGTYSNEDWNEGEEARMLEDFKRDAESKMIQQQTVENDVLSEEMLLIKQKAIEDGTYLKAPNGSDSRLLPNQWLLVRTQRFKEWFGDWENDPKNASKAIDLETGEPMPLYHGSIEDFNEFQNREARIGKTMGEGHYFTSSASEALFYANTRLRKDSQPTVKQYFLRLANPLQIDAVRPLSEEEANTSKDGIIVRNAHDFSPRVKSDIMVAYSSSQIKLATVSSVPLSQTFNPQSEDIRFSAMTDSNEADIRFSAEVNPVITTPTDNVVAEGIKFSIQDFARLAGNIFQDMPESFRKEAIEDTFKRGLDMQSAIFQTTARLAEKESWDESDKELANVIRDKVQDAMDESGVVMSRPLTTKEALWMLYRSTGANTDSMLDAAKRSLVAYNLGFDPKSMAQKKAADDIIRYSVVRSRQIDAATDMYNYEANLWTSRLAESWLDMNQSVIALQNALADASGKPIESWEDVVLALNQLSSKSYADKKKYMRDFLKPLWDAVMDIVRNTDFKIEDIERYMMLKHGLERNEKFAKRDAKQFYKEMFDKVADRMKNTSHAEQVVALSEAKKRIADIDAQIATAKGKKLKELQEARERAVLDKEIAELVLRGDEKQNEQDLQNYYDNIDNELNQKYWEFREKDYGGLTSMFQEKLHDVKRKDYKTEEAYQKALLASVKPKYDKVAEMENAAKDEVFDFEEAVPSYYDLWKKTNAATKEVLRHQHASGVITTEQYDAVRNMFKYYVPLRGFADNTAEDMYSYFMDNSAGGFAKPIIAAKGRKTRAESPLGWIGTMAESAIQQDNKNEAKMKLYYALMNRPDTGVLSLSEMWYEFSHKDPDTGKKVFVPAYPPATGKALSADELRQHMDAWEDSMKAKQAIGEAYRREQGVNLGGSVIFQDKAQDAEHIIRVKVAGKDYTILVNGNPRAAQAINGILNPESNVGPVMQWYGELRRGMSALMTSFSPLFWVANYQRDLLSAFMRTSESEGWGQAFRYLGNRWQAWRVAKYVYAYDNGTMGDSYYENLYKEFAENGGITGYTSLTTNKEYEKLLEDYAKHVDQKALNWIKGVWDKFMGFGEAIEQVSRFAAYITAREAGEPIAKAVAAAKEVSVNFNRKGSAQPISLDELDRLRDRNGKPLSMPKKAVAIALSAMPAAMKQLYFFFNASIQALSSSAKLAIKSPGKAAAWAGMYMGMSMGLAAINYMLSGDDDEEEYLDLPDYLRHSTALIKVSDEYYLKWSLPQEMRPFYATADIILSKAMGNMPHKNVGKEVALAMAEWLPVNPFGTEDPLLALVPDVGAPFAEVKANRNSFGGKIYDDMSFKSEEVVKNIPAYRKGTSKTGKVYVDLTELLNDLSGGDEVQKGAINLNPAIMEHLVEGYGGGIYDFAKMMVSLPGLIASDEPLEVRDIPFVNKVILSTDETNMYSHTNDAFNHYRNVSENAQRVEKEYFTSDDPSRAEAYRQEDDWRIHLLYKQYEEELKDFRERLDKAVDETEIELLREQQNAVREQLLNDIATGTQPDPLFEAKIDMDRKFDELSELRKTIVEASKRGDAEAAEQAQKELEQYVESEDFKRYAELRPYVNAYAKLRKALKETYNADTRQDLENAAKEAKAALDEKLKDF